MWNRTGRTDVNSLNMENLINAKNPEGISVSYSNGKDFNCLKKQINTHENAWKRTPTIFGSHMYQVYDRKDGSRTPNYDKTLELFDFCTDTLGMRCIIGNNSLLHTENNTDKNINRAITRTGNKGFNTYYQTHVMTNSGSKTFTFDDLIVAIDNAASWGAMMIELPMGWDCPYAEEKVNDPLTCTDAEYKSSFLENGRNLLKANYKE